METKQVKSSYYLIREDGCLYTQKKNRLLKGMVNNAGYRQYFLDDKWEFAHRLVGEYFVTKPEGWDENYEIDHLDENKLNNHWTNLEWVTHQENVRRSFERGTRKKTSGKDHWNFGGKASEESKKLMSQKKLGEKHPRFSGWFVVKGIKYGSTREAEQATGIPYYNIHRWCKNGLKGLDFTFEPLNA